jgi:hypothetical protein
LLKNSSTDRKSYKEESKEVDIINEELPPTTLSGFSSKRKSNINFSFLPSKLSIKPENNLVKHQEVEFPGLQPKVAVVLGIA